MLEKKTTMADCSSWSCRRFFIAKGEKVTQFFAGWVTVLGAFSVSEWGVIEACSWV
ncbi:hypothetical protein [Vibrio cortegadensis]|uniref:hypothetical protein n=1 Tax=Vibrio cortegadensis TaxID=1328770 RepID=UPI0021C26957|nr:hypothetical protein [Vibrio cortegadensis]